MEFYVELAALLIGVVAVALLLYRAAYRRRQGRAALEPSTAPVIVSPAAAPRESRRGDDDVAILRKGLGGVRGGFVARLAAALSGARGLDPAVCEQLEEAMLTSDVGVRTSKLIVDRLRARFAKGAGDVSSEAWGALRGEALRVLDIGGDTPLRLSAPEGASGPVVWLVVGVNGVGKTTTIGKLATRLRGEGKSVLLAAADTFRAAAVQQLQQWGARVGVDVIAGAEGADPASVAFEATQAAIARNVDVLIVDTAGRLHTKAPLMDEIRKVRRTIAKALPGAPHEIFLVVDATTGQNGLAQAAVFKEAVDLTGIVLTKLDGTAKGGIVLGICDELKVPVRFIGLGESADHLREFHAGPFVEALFGTEEAYSNKTMTVQ